MNFMFNYFVQLSFKIKFNVFSRLGQSPSMGLNGCLNCTPHTYLCESDFSKLAYLKNKYRARLEPENDMRLSLSTISPRIDTLCGLHHAQILH